MTDNNEVIDVEVEEEVIETMETEVMYTEEEGAPAYSDEDIDQMLIQLKDTMILNGCEASETSSSLAKQMATNSKEYLDNETYLWVMYAYGQKYKKEGNPNAQRFCYIRMMSVLDAMDGRRKKQAALTFVDAEAHEPMVKEVIENTSFMKTAAAKLKQQFLLMELVMLLVFVGLMVFIFRYSIPVTIGFCALLLFANYMMTYRSLFDRYYKEQTEASKSHCQDKELVDFDLPVYLS